MSDELTRLAHELAYSAARSDIECHCLRGPDAGMAPHYDLSTADSDDRPMIATACRYLDLRGLLIRGEGPEMVLIRDDDDAFAEREEEST